MGRTRRGQGQGRGRKDQARPTSGSECEGLPGAAVGGPAGKHRANRGQDGQDGAGQGTKRKGRRGAEVEVGRTERGPRPPDREESGERRGPYLSRAGHVEGGPSRCLRGQRSRASRLAGQGCSKPARPRLHRDRSRGRGHLPLPAPADTHFRSPAGGFHVVAMLDAAHRKGPARARVEPARPSRPALALRPHLQVCALHAPLQPCGPFLPAEHSLASRRLHSLFLVSVVLRNHLPAG